MSISESQERELQRLLEAYRSGREGATTFDLAEREWRIVNLAVRLGLGKWGTSGSDSIWSWFTGQVGGNSYEPRMRRSIRTLVGEATEALWRQVDGGMPVATALAVARSAASRVDRRDPTALRRAIAEELAALASSGSRLSKYVQVEDVVAPEPAAPPEIPSVSVEVDDDRSFWKDVRSAILKYAEARMPSVPDREEYAIRLFGDLQTTMEIHQDRWRVAEREAAGHVQRVTRARLRDSMVALHVDTPARREDLDAYLKRVKRQHRTLAATYHPDRRGGSEDMREQYEAVNTAYRVIEQWVEEEKRKRGAAPATENPKLRVVRGG